MKEIIASFFLFMGSLFCFLTSIGIIRLPDFYMRIQALTKTATFGLGLILFSLIFPFRDIVVTPRALIILFFIFLTNPVSAHMLGRAAYFVKVPLWKGTITDELEGKYDHETHQLRGIRKVKSQELER